MYLQQACLPYSARHSLDHPSSFITAYSKFFNFCVACLGVPLRCRHQTPEKSEKNSNDICRNRNNQLNKSFMQLFCRFVWHCAAPTFPNSFVYFRVVTGRRRRLKTHTHIIITVHCSIILSLSLPLARGISLCLHASYTHSTMHAAVVAVVVVLVFFFFLFCSLVVGLHMCSFGFGSNYQFTIP